MRSNSTDLLEKNPLKPVYLLSSEEPLLRDEALQKIKEKGKEQDYSVSHSFTVDSHFKWDDFFKASHQTDLFSEKKIFILNLSSPKLTLEASKIVADYFSHEPSSKQIIIFLTKKLDALTLKSKWLEALDKVGVIIQLFAPDKKSSGQWISTRAKQYSLEIAPEAITTIMELTEGNLTATAQVVDRLFLEYGSGGKISETEVKQALFNSAQYSIYDLTDNWLQSKTKACLKILTRLKKEGTEPTLVLWALMTECRTLARIQFDLHQNISLETALNTHRVWQKRIPLIRQHLKTKVNYLSLLEQLNAIEKTIKGSTKGNVWEMFERFLL